jgi:hypothetical protein
MVAVERFEVSILLLMEAHQDCHDLAQAQRSLALTVGALGTGLIGFSGLFVIQHGFRGRRAGG